MPELLRLITLINSDQLLIGSELELILALRISAVHLIYLYLSLLFPHLVLTGGSIAAGVVGALGPAGVTERPPPARAAVTAVTPSLQCRESVVTTNKGRDPGQLGFSQTGESFAT